MQELAGNINLNFSLIIEMCEKKYLIDNQLLMKEWDYEANVEFNPQKLLNASNKTVWWICSKCGHHWKAKISNRTILRRGCPCCANKIVVIGKNDLNTTHPEIAKEWHPTKNGLLWPQDVTHGSGKKVWWLCAKGHAYQATVLHRTQKDGTGCPICYSGRQTSFAEQAVYYYVKKVFPDAINRYTAPFLKRMELDIYIPSLKTAIEYDGEAWHKEDKIHREELKKLLCEQHGIKLFRLREKMPEQWAKSADYFIGTKDLYKPKNLSGVIFQLLLDLQKFFVKRRFPKIDIENDRIKILEYCNELDNNSFEQLFPRIAKEWHKSKNGILKPNMFKSGSDHKVWWQCPDCGHEYQASISHRTGKHPTGCPKCGIIKSALKRSKAVSMIDSINSKTIRSFSSIKEASQIMNINHRNISTVCKGKRPKAGGFAWKYIDE